MTKYNSVSPNMLVYIVDHPCLYSPLFSSDLYIFCSTLFILIWTFPMIHPCKWGLYLAIFLACYFSGAVGVPYYSSRGTKYLAHLINHWFYIWTKMWKMYHFHYLRGPGERIDNQTGPIAAIRSPKSMHKSNVKPIRQELFVWSREGWNISSRMCSPMMRPW